VAWAVEREGGGRGFSTSTGHFFENWKNDNYRKLMLNAIMWTAGMEIPAGGIESQYVEAEAVEQALMIKPISALLVAPDATLVQVLNSETPRFRVTVASDFETQDFAKYKLIVLSECDWSAVKGKERLLPYLKRGGGLTLIHVSGSFPELEKLGLVPVTPIPSEQASAVYRIHVADRAHVAAHGVEDFDTTDLFPDISASSEAHILATAQLKEGGQPRPVAFVNSSSKARMFQTVLGRDTAAILIPGTAQLIRYGSLWAAKDK